MNALSIAQKHELLDRLRAMAFLQNLLWREAITISDELLDCELDTVLRQVADLAMATAAPGEDLTHDDLDNFLENCRRIVVVQASQ